MNYDVSRIRRPRFAGSCDEVSIVWQFERVAVNALSFWWAVTIHLSLQSARPTLPSQCSVVLLVGRSLEKNMLGHESNQKCGWYAGCCPCSGWSAFAHCTCTAWLDMIKRSLHHCPLQRLSDCNRCVSKPFWVCSSNILSRARIGTVLFSK